MKLFLFISIFFCVAPQSHQTLVANNFNLTTFTKIPREYSDCGNGWYYLSQKDIRNKKYIVVTDYDNALVCINNKTTVVKVIERGYLPNKYSVIIKDGAGKNVGDESTTMTSVIIVQFGNKILWKRNLIGFNGC